MKKTLSLMLAVLFLLSSVFACSAPATPAPTAVPPTEAPAVLEPTVAPTEAAPVEATVDFTDSVGRVVKVPAQIERIAVAGPMSQIVVFAVAPDKLVGVSSKWSKEAAQYLDARYANLPELGQLYGGKGELNLETLLKSGAQVVIDVGEPKKSIVEDLDGLQKQTGLPFVHITGTLATMGDAYRKLGELLGMKDQAEVLASYCEKVYAQSVDLSKQVQKVNLLYITGDTGLNVIAQGSFHAEAIDLLANNLAVVAEPSGKGTGNETDLEQIIKWNPDVILFAPQSIYATVGQDPAWQSVNAIKNGRYYEVPFGPYNWMGFPPSAQRYLGLLWMSSLLYPETANIDLQTAVTEYFQLFYHSTLTAEQYQALVANSISKLPSK